MPAVTKAPATIRIDSACPIAIGSSDSNTTERLFRLSPSATANSQPMAGLRPWKAPSPASTSQGHRSFMRTGLWDLGRLDHDADQFGSLKRSHRSRRGGSEPRSEEHTSELQSR